MRLTRDRAYEESDCPAYIPGGGIDPEVMEAALGAAECRVGGFRLVYDRLDGGAVHYRDTGVAFLDESFRPAGGGTIAMGRRLRLRTPVLVSAQSEVR